MNLTQEADFFNDIAPKIIAYVTQELQNVEIVKQKSNREEDMNFATHIDMGVEKIITDAIQQLFPEDKILAEEAFSETQIPKSGRIWIIDPICGTGNIARQIPLFATNIALAEDGKLIASCVVDHQEKTYYYSTGENKILKEGMLYDVSKKSTGTIIDIDLFAAQTRNSLEVKKRYGKFVYDVYTNTSYALITYNTSLGFTLAAVGKLDGCISPYHSLWDVAAPNFLMMQAGGIVTDIDGNPWNFSSGSIIAAKDPAIHKKLLEIYQESE